MKLVLFDLDNTLLAGDSDYRWGQFLVTKGVVNPTEYERKNRECYEQYVNGTLDIHAFLAFSLAPLAKVPMATLQDWREEFFERDIRPIMTTLGQQEILNYQKEGATVAIITATHAFITRRIADAFGVEHLIATELEEVNGQFTGRPRGTPCFREGKITRLQEWLNGRTWSHLTFYSDSQNDLPLLSLADTPIAVDPDPVLRAYAEARGWAIRSFRSPEQQAKERA